MGWLMDTDALIYTLYSTNLYCSNLGKPFDSEWFAGDAT